MTGKDDDWNQTIGSGSGCIKDVLLVLIVLAVLMHLF